MSEQRIKSNFYVLKYLALEESLCFMEMKYLFREEIKAKCFFSDSGISPSRSPFIKHRIAVEYSADTLEKLLRIIEEHKTSYTRFKFVRFKIENGELEYAEWIRSVTQIGNAIDGEADMENPLVLLAAAPVGGKWIFGEYEENDNEWKYHDKKPNTNSHSLGIRTARALVNIAVGPEKKRTLIDPCCGVGTVLIEAASMGIEASGREINPLIASKAAENLAFFGIDNIITLGDMHDIKETFDAAIVDIPYGLFTPITLKEQQEIILTARRIARKMVIITFEDMDAFLLSSGFSIIDRCQVHKGKFTRYISVCV